MTRNARPHALTAERLLELRLLATGATRRPTGEPYVPDRIRVRWLAEHGFVRRTKVPPDAGAGAWRASIVVTETGWRAMEGSEGLRLG
ncbi:MAG TPA: hypothetical protein VFT22_07545 [Kofleriaceae bacterium]|nr:hypothetical protein [Kofleriaceae bacterium]